MNASMRGRMVAGLLACAAALAAQAQGSAARPQEMLGALLKDPKALSAAVQAGAGVAEFCANCHGPNGNSTQSDVPNLAGQNPVYLLDQVQRYADGRRRDDFMQGLTKVLDPAQRVNLVLYYANQAPVRQPAPALPVAQRGKRLYAELCESCHGEDGLGDEKLARIAGQQQRYLTTTMQRYRGRPGQRSDTRMGRVARDLSDDELRAIVAYVSVMR